MKRLLSIILIISLIIQMTFIGYADETINYQEFSDVKGHWAEETIKKHHKMGMLSGYPDGSFKPDQQMKRSELITLVNKYFGLKEEGNQNFKDVVGEEWYSEETAKAKYYGYIKDLEARPKDLASREDVVNMMSLIIDVEEQRQVSEKKDFKDLRGSNEKENIEKFSQMGYISGYEDGTFKPKGIINRAEIMIIVENVLGYIITSQEDIENMPDDVTKITIINPNIIIENKEIKGNLYIAPGVNGKVIIKNTKIHGQIDISGGTTKKPIQLENVEVEKIVITKVKITPKVEITGKSHVGELKTKSKTELKLDKGTKVEKLVIEAKTKVETEKGSKIENLEIKEKAEITGQGTINKAEIKSKEVTIEKRPDYIKVDEKAGDIQIGKEKMNAKNDDRPENKESSHSKKNNNNNDNDMSNKDTNPPCWIQEYPLAEMKTGELEIKIQTKLNEKGTIYYAVQEDNKTFTVEELISRGNSYHVNENTVVEEVYSNGLSSEKNYKVYLVAVDDHNNKQSSVKEIQVKKIDTKAPEWAEGYPFAEMKSSELEIKIHTKLNEKSTVYYTVYQAVYGEDITFTVDDLISIGKHYNVEENTVVEEVYDGGLTSGKTYNIYLTAVDDHHNKQNSVKTVKVSEIDTTPPIFTKKQGKARDALGTIKFSAQTNEASKIYYVLVEEGSMIPTVAQVKAGTDYSGVPVMASGNQDVFTNEDIKGMSYKKNYEIYLMAQDSSGNITSEVSKISIYDPIITKIKQGWIPIANKIELKQIEIEGDNTFGAGTRWEDIYTGGMNKKYMLVVNIDLAGDNFVPIGYDEVGDRSVPFTGKLIGQGHEITHLNIERDKELQGLFSQLGTGSWLSEISIKDITMKTASKSGVLAGEANGAEISSSTISNVTYALFENMPGEQKITKYIGGFIGKSTNTSFKELELNGFQMHVTGDFDLWNASYLQNIGGITGLLNGGALQEIEVKHICIKSVSDPAKRKYYPIVRSGGLVGELQNAAIETLFVDQCTVFDLILIVCGGNGKDYAGGLVGKIDTTDTEISTNGDIVLKNSKASGLIQGKGKKLGSAGIGGFVSYVDGTNTPSGYIAIENCSAHVNINELDIEKTAADVMAQGGIGGFAAILKKAKVFNCYATGRLDSPFLSGAGGFAGYVMESVIENSYATGDVLGYMNLGGFASMIKDSQINQCYATGDIGENDNQAGVLIFTSGGFAFMIDDSTLFNDYCLGQVKEASRDTGAGFSSMLNNSSLTNIYTSSKVMGNNKIFAYMTQNETSITNSYWSKTVNPTGDVILNNGGTRIIQLEGKTDIELEQKSTFIDWDFKDVWEIKEGANRPTLKGVGDDSGELVVPII